MNVTPKTVLFVDDEEMLREIGEEMLTDLGYRVLLAGDGEDALSVFIENQETIDLVILDMIMPKMNGEETFKEMIKIQPDVKVIISSGYSKDGQAPTILQHSKCAFLQKPYDYDDMEERLKQVLG